MSAGGYLLGVLWLGAIGAALGFGAVRLRRRLLPAVDRATARLAEIVLALGAFVLVPELLGAVGLFRRVPVLLALVGVGVGAGILAGRTPTPAAVPAERDDPPASSSTALARVATSVAVVLAAAVLAQWTGHVVATYTSTSSGIWDGDSLWYHLPFATEFVQTGWVTRLRFTNADTLVTYFPAGSEIVLGLVMLPFRRDLVVPVVNLGWLLLAFLAAWSLGRRYGAAAVALGGTALALSLPVMAVTQAGTARNDVMGVALFLSAAALVAHARWERGAMAVAGIAAGLALGVKLSTVVPVALLAVAVVVAAPRARRWSATLPWAGSIVVFGAFWYVRNLVLVGNPVPTVGFELGPIRLPKVFAESIADTAVVDRLTEAGGIGRVLRPGLDEGFGDLWWLVLVVVVAVAVTTIARGPGRVARLLGAVVLLGGVGYVLMPNGSPFGDTDLGAANFMLNLRYVLPVLTLGLALVAVLPRMRDPRLTTVAVLGFGLVAAVTARDRHLADRWEWAVSDRQLLVGVGVVAVAVVLVACVVVVAGRRPGWVVPLVAVLAGTVLVGGFVVQREYADRRYREPRTAAEARASAVWPWARDVGDTRIGVVGTLLQYPYAGPALRSTVRYVGVRNADGGFRSVASCRELVEELIDGRFRYLVAAHDFFGSNVAEIDRINRWVRAIPGVTVVEEEPWAWVYEFERSPDPRACS